MPDQFSNAQQIRNFGGIIQFQCNDSDPYQAWTVQRAAHYVFQNVGASA